MKKKKICILLACILALPFSVHAQENTEIQVMDAADTHIEITGEDPVYPDAPEGFENYEDYKQNTGYVHDTEFYYDQDSKTWYCYFTNSSEIRSSKDLVTWTKEETNRNGNAWAPCIIKLRQPVQYDGKSYSYALWDSYSEFGTRRSQIRLWLSNSPKGEFVQAGNTIVSQDGDGKNHNAIDPAVFYDKEGKLWMTFGSFFGGIYVFELDPATCMPKEPSKLPGTRIAYRSTYGNSIEGPTIFYNPNTDYYYLNVSYGSLDHTYNVRIGRSKNVEGPYYDYNGLPMDNSGYSTAQSAQIGTKITTPYYFEPDNGWYSTAHSAFLYNPDTKEYFLSHNARLETIANSGTRLNIRRLIWTEDGWPVVSPELYTGSETTQKIPSRLIPGTYQIIEMLREDLPVNPISAVKRGNDVIELKEDHTIEGAYDGTWAQTGEHTLKLVLDGVSYTVDVSTAWDWENWTQCLVFTGLSEACAVPEQAITDVRSGVALWGKRVEAEDLIRSFIEQYRLPEIVQSDIVFPEINCKGVTVTVKSMRPDMITDEGRLVNAKPAEDTAVEFKVTFSMGEEKIEKMYKVTVPAYKGTLLANLRMEGEVRDSSLYERGITLGNGQYSYENGITGKAFRNEKIANNDGGLIRLENNLLTSRNKDAFTISLWIRPDALTDHTAVFFAKGSSRWLSLMPCHNESKTPAVRVRDDVTNTWSDLKASSALPTGTWTLFTYVYDNGTTYLYLNGEEAAKSDKILNPFEAEEVSFYVGGNSWDPSFNGLIDEVSVWEEAWSPESVKTYYQTTTKVVRPADKAALQEAIRRGKEELGQVTVSVDGKDVEKEAFWVTEEEKEALVNAVERAEAVERDAQADQNLTNAETEDLQNRMQVFLSKKKQGSKPAVPQILFEDVKEGDWFYDAVVYNFANKYMQGKDDTHFAPYESLVRAQFAVILHRIEGEPEADYKNPFPDVADGEWYTDAILWAAEKKIVTGYTDSGLFGTPDDINREQMAVMMYRYAQYKKYAVDEMADFSRFEDADSVSRYAKEAMQWAVGTGIITGKYEGTRIDPQGKALRAECAIIMERFMEYYTK